MHARARVARARATVLAAAVLLLGGAALAPEARADRAVLLNGDRLTGEVVSMAAGKLVFKAPWDGEVKIDWPQVRALVTDKPVRIVLGDESELKGRFTDARDGKLRVQTGTLDTWISHADVVAINPEVKPPILWTGFLRFGGAITDGNTQTSEANSEAQVVARAESLRLLLRGGWTYAEDRVRDELIKRSAFAETKLDFFVFKGLYLYANATFLGDTFKDLNLRSTFGAGVGFQWLESERVSLFTEGGLSYVVEDRRRGDDDQTLAARGAWRFDWQVILDGVKLFHLGEVLPSLEDQEDVFLRTSTGLRFTIWQGMFAAFQVDFHWDNAPPPGVERRDILYIASIGYEF